MKHLLLLCAVLALVGCQKKIPDASSPFASKAAVNAPDRIDASFTVVQAAAISTDGHENVSAPNALHLKIAKASLEKEFLLQAGLLVQPIAPMGSSLRSRIVSFRQWGKDLFLLEATQGHSVDRTLPQTLILAKFPILEETETHLAFDFNQGMSQIFLSRDWKASDFEGGNYRPEYLAVKTKASFLSRAETVNNKLVIHQVAQVEAPAGPNVDGTTHEIRYYLSPYRPNPGFTPFRSTSFERVGYFETAPFLDDEGNSVVHATKFDLKRPVVFAISSNTPPEFRAAVREGILYFNKALGEGAIQVVDAPEGLTAPQADYNIVQWVKWDGGMGAYADAQMDPRTGETLNAQVYFASVFAVMGKKGARTLLHRLKNPTSMPAALTLKGFTEEAPCGYLDHKPQQMAAQLESFLATDPSDEAVLRMAQDFVRDIVAHEIGHTLGLRHNFAGSLHANTDLKARDEAFHRYLLEGVSPQHVITTSSVMDYNTTFDAIITGYHIQNSPRAMEYDEKALRVLYKGASYAPTDMPLFCTDTMADGAYIDCLRGDEGTASIPAVVHAQKKTLETFADNLFEGFLTQKEAINKGRQQKFIFSPEGEIFPLVYRETMQLQALLTSKRSLKGDRSFTDGGSLYEKEKQAGYLALIEEQFAKVGGVAAALPGPAPEFFASEQARFVTLLDRRGAQEGLSAQEIALLKETAPLFFARASEALIELELSSLAKITGEAGLYRDTPLADELAAWLGAKAEAVIFAQEGVIQAEVELPGEDGVLRKITVTLPKFSAKHAQRVAAAGLLKSGQAESLAWGLGEKFALQERLKKAMNDALQTPQEKVNPSRLPSPVARWLLENRQVLAALGG